MNKVEKYIIENNLLQKDDKVLVALSGGPDSVAMLKILTDLKKDLGIQVAAVHVNHLLRGKEAIADEEYVQKLCNSLNIKCYIKRIDIDKISKELNISHELAGRECRYKVFEEIRSYDGYNKIAIAHNANDQAETILMRLMRGAGLDGLTGIKCAREGGIIRPILCLTREEIEKYCQDEKLEPRIDKSNYERVYNRNKVRLDLIPYIKEHFNDDIIQTLNRTGLLLKNDNDYLEKQADRIYNRYCIEDDKSLTLNNALFNEDQCLVSRVIKRGFKVVSKSYKNFEMKHIYEVINLSKMNTGKEIHLTNDIIAKNNYGNIVFQVRGNKVEESDEEMTLLKNDVPINIEYNNYYINLEVIEKKNSVEFSNNDLIKFFDYDKIEERIIIRNRRDGDKIIPLGMNGSKKIKDIFINLKVPREVRDSIPILWFDEKAAWIVGYKVSQEFRITNETKKILKISFVRKE